MVAAGLLCIQKQLQVTLLGHRPLLQCLSKPLFAERSSGGVSKGHDAKAVLCGGSAMAVLVAVAMAGVGAVGVVAIAGMAVAMAMTWICAARVAAIAGVAMAVAMTCIRTARIMAVAGVAVRVPMLLSVAVLFMAMLLVAVLLVAVLVRPALHRTCEHGVEAHLAIGRLDDGGLVVDGLHNCPGRLKLLLTGQVRLVEDHDVCSLGLLHQKLHHRAVAHLAHVTIDQVVPVHDTLVLHVLLAESGRIQQGDHFAKLDAIHHVVPGGFGLIEVLPDSRWLGNPAQLHHDLAEGPVLRRQLQEVKNAHQ
mmetsp:Transcript_134751/g.319401  ORF Transcript_134751/g.319401 Transcript_134751/m.319401 type:complete len:307 (-) Transcript_134751:532-1452(-)